MFCFDRLEQYENPHDYFNKYYFKYTVGYGYLLLNKMRKHSLSYSHVERNRSQKLGPLKIQGGKTVVDLIVWEIETCQI